MSESNTDKSTSTHDEAATTAAAVTATREARAEQLARLFDEIYVTLAPTFGLNPTQPVFDELPIELRQLRIATAAKIIGEGWTAPELVVKMRRDYGHMTDLYLDTAKAVGLQPDDNMEDGPQKARNLAAMVSRWEALAVERALKLAEGTRDEEEIALPGSEVHTKPGMADDLDFAAGELYDAAKGYAQANDVFRGTKCERVAQALLEIKVMLYNPVKTLRLIAKDRDLWQMKCEAVEEKLAYTELALGQSQDAVIDLTKGHDRMIKLLERFAKMYSDLGRRPGVSISTEGAEWRQLVDGVTALLNSPDLHAIDV